MDLLPKDIIIIVYRLIFDVDYVVLKQQYKQTYCGTVDVRQIGWDDDTCTFGTESIFVANWRSDKRLKECAMKPIYDLTTRKKSRSYFLPNRYVYSMSQSMRLPVY